MTEDELTRMLVEWFMAAEGIACDDPEEIGFEDRGTFNARKLARYLLSKGVIN